MVDNTPPALSYEAFLALSPQDQAAYFDAGGDMSEVFRHGEVVRQNQGPRPEHLPVLVEADQVAAFAEFLDRHPGVAVLPYEEEPMTVISMRLPAPTLNALDALAGDSAEGRSGVIRAAVREYLERHRDEAA